MVIIINGPAGSGKTTFCEYCIEEGKKIGIDVANISTVDYVKEVAKFCGWDGSKSEKDRAFLSELKSALTKWNEIPNKKIKEITDQRQKKNQLTFVHCREPQEIRKLVQLTNAQTLYFDNNRVKPISSNDSDKNVENYIYNIYLHNNWDLECLRELAKYFVEDYKKEELE